MDAMERLTSPRRLLALTWPIFIELVLQMLVGNIDQIMISQFSQNSVGAIGNANQIINFLIFTLSVISTAATILITQYLGSGNTQKVHEVYTVALLFNIAFSLAVSVLLLLFNRPVFGLMRVPEEILGESSLYISIIGSCMLFQGVYLAFSAFFRANAMMKESMVISVLMNLLNIAGNAVLLWGIGPFPQMGIVGVAISSNLSRLIGVIVIICLFVRRFGPCISLRLMRPFPRRQLRLLLSIGLPSGGESVSYDMSQIVIQSFANLFGTRVINAKVYCAMFANLSYVFASALSQGCQIVVGYLIGGANAAGADLQVRRAIGYSLLVSTTVSTLLFLFSRQIFGLFTSDPQTLELIRIIMAIEIPLEIGRAVNMTMVRSLQAAGDIRYPITLGVICMWGLAVGLGYILGVVLGWGLPGIWAGMAIDECVRAVCFIFRWRGGRWRSISLIKEEK